MDKEKLIKEFEEICGYTMRPHEFHVLNDVLALLKEQEIVRCKDCKKRDSWECWQYFFGRIKIPDDWFCADGERKEEDE